MQEFDPSPFARRFAPRLIAGAVAFLASLYYAPMRPAEALHLRIEDCELPKEGGECCGCPARLDKSGTAGETTARPYGKTGN